MLSEKAKSKSQQRFFGMVRAAQKGEMDNPSSEVLDAADSMKVGDVKKFAKTKHKGLPEKKKVEEGNLHKWFSGSKSKDGKKGWVNVVTGGTCASDKPGEGTPKCVSSSKRASMTKAERLSASRRKKAADPGQQQKSGAAKPTYVATDKKKKVNESKGTNETTKYKGVLADPMKEAYRVLASSDGQEKPSQFSYKDEKTAKKYVDSIKKGGGKATITKESVLTAIGRKKKKEEKKAPKAMDAGARAKRLLQRRVHAKYVSGSTENVPDDIRDHYDVTEKCWDGYTQKGMKKKGKKVVPNCVPVGEAKEEQGRSDYGKASVRNKRKFGKEGEPAIFDTSGERGKMIDQRRADHKAKRGVKEGKGYQPEIEVIKSKDLKRKERDSKLPPHLQGDALGKMKKAFASTNEEVVGEGAMKAIKNFVNPDPSLSNEPSVRAGVRTPKTGFKHVPSFSKDGTSGSYGKKGTTAVVDTAKPVVKKATQVAGNVTKGVTSAVAKGIKQGATAVGKAVLPVAGGVGAGLAVSKGVDNLMKAGKKKKVDEELSIVDKMLIEFAPTPVKEGVVDAVKKGAKRHKDAVEKKKIKNRKAVPYAALAAEHEPEGNVVTEADKKGKGSGKKDACYNKVKASAKVWPSAYASGRLVQCRKKGASNYGNKSEGFSSWRDELDEGAAWTKKSGKSASGGLNEKGRKSYERENPGSDLKAPSKEKGNKRRASFCARMKGMKKKLTSAKTASDPDSRINKSLRAWDC